MKAIVKKSNQSQIKTFPCLMKNKKNNMILLVTGELQTGYQGVCLSQDDKQYHKLGQIRIGTGGYVWDKSDLVMCKETVELSNDNDLTFE